MMTLFSMKFGMKMTEFQREYTDGFKKDLKKLRKNKELQGRLKRKIKEIQKDPFHYKPLRNVLKNRRRVHIGSFVLIFEVHEEQKKIIFHSLDYHDDAY